MKIAIYALLPLSAALAGCLVPESRVVEGAQQTNANMGDKQETRAPDAGSPDSGKAAEAKPTATTPPASKSTTPSTQPMTSPMSMATPSKPSTTPATVPTRPAAAGSSAMGAAGSPAANSGTSTNTLPAAPPKTSGPAPTLPEIVGECPEFTDGTTIMVAGHRSIQLRVGAANKGGPILFYWHGTGSSASEAQRFPGNSEIVAMGGIAAAFNGSQSSGAGSDCSGTGAHNMADFEAADQIAACAVKNHGADPRRIYSAGCSAGGLQTGCMAMVRSSYLAAAAANSGGITSPQPWQDEHSPAIFTMHGGSGDMVIVTFSQTSATLDMNAKQHGSFVVNCDHGGGHCAAPANLYQAAWQFMKDHPWGQSTSPWQNGIPADVPSYCKIFE